MCRYDGELIFEDDGQPKYLGGKKKAMGLNPSSKHSELQKLIYRKTNISPSEYDIDIIFNWPQAFNKYTAYPITDDDDTTLILGSFQPSAFSALELFIVKKAKTINDAENFITHHSMEVYPNIPSENTSFGNQACVDFVTSIPVVDTQCSMQFEAGIGSSNQTNFCMLDGANVMNPYSMQFEAGTSSQAEQDHDTDSDDDEPVNHMPPLNSMDVAAQQDDRGSNEWIHTSYFHNEYRVLDDPHPDDADINDLAMISAVDPLTLDMNRFVIRSEDIGWNVGDVFESKEKLKQLLFEWCMKNSVQLKPKKCEAGRYTVECRSDDCNWRLHSSVRKGDPMQRFVIRSIGPPHTCSQSIVVEKHKQAKSSVIANFVLPILRESLSMTPNDIVLICQQVFYTTISYKVAWSARSKAISKIFGDWEASYQTLSSYLHAVSCCNPGTVYHIVHKDVSPGVKEFDCVFWAFGPSIEGFKHCRPILCIDGTHLYGKYKGSLLVATGIDADGGLYPLAYAVVENESTETWKWFFYCMMEMIPSLEIREMTFITDRMRGISAALEVWPGRYHHRYCMRHIRSNFKKSVKADEALQNMLWQAACTPDELEYVKLRQTMETDFPSAHRYIEKSLKDQEDRWALCKDGGRRFSIMTTNASESFNGVLRGSRGLPITALVARTFHRLNQYFFNRRTTAESWTTVLTPSTERLLAKRIKDARYFQRTQFSQVEWQIIGNDGLSYQVIAENPQRADSVSCSCNIPKLQKLPCSHVIKALSRAPQNFASAWYSTTKYRACYAPLFHPVHDSRYWPQYYGPIILPPRYKRRAGRPASVRIKNNMDEGREGQLHYKCGQCKQTGHNKSRCTNPPQQNNW